MEKLNQFDGSIRQMLGFIGISDVAIYGAYSTNDIVQGKTTMDAYLWSRPRRPSPDSYGKLKAACLRLVVCPLLQGRSIRVREDLLLFSSVGITSGLAVLRTFVSLARQGEWP